MTAEELVDDADERLFSKVRYCAYTIRYDTIEEINVDSKAEYTA